jgi:hypothetical protein
MRKVIIATPKTDNNDTQTLVKAIVEAVEKKLDVEIAWVSGHIGQPEISTPSLPSMPVEELIPNKISSYDSIVVKKKHQPKGHQRPYKYHK